MKAVVLAAGEGTRLRPLTFIRPKPLTPLGPEPSIYYLMRQLAKEGFDEVVVIAGGSQKDQIMDYLGDGSKFGVKITYAVKPDEFQCGTAGSLRLAEHLLNETFLVAQADTLTETPLASAVAFHKKSKAHATIVLTKVQDPAQFGVAVLGENDEIVGFQEKPKREEAKSNLVSTGFYILEPDALDYIADEKFDFAKDLFPRLLALHKKVSGFISDSFWVDIGTVDGYLGGVRWVLNQLARERPKSQTRGRFSRVVVEEGAHIGHNVKITGPTLIERGAVVDEGANIGQYTLVKANARIGPGAQIEGSVIMEDTTIGRDSEVIDSVVGASATLLDNVVVRRSVVGAGCTVESRTKLLEGSSTWPNTRVGEGEVVKGRIEVPLEKAFYFYRSYGQYTGVLTRSVDGMVDALRAVPIESIEFHVKGRDFERWARDIIGSNELADEFEKTRVDGLRGEELREGCISIAQEFANEGPRRERLMTGRTGGDPQAVRAMLSHMRSYMKVAQQLYGGHYGVPFEYADVSNVIFLGMGGSGVVGEVIKDMTENRMPKPVHVRRRSDLPAFADEHSLVFAVSYSGNTFETLAALGEAVFRGCKVVVVTSGGAMMDIANSRKIPLIEIPKGYQPREALPFMLFPILKVFRQFGWPIEEVRIEELESRLESVESLAMDIAPKLAGKTTVVYTEYPSVGHRLKTQINENARAPASYDLVTELFHNEVNAWKNLKNFHAILIREKGEGKGAHDTFEIAKTLLDPLNYTELQTIGSNRSTRIMYAIWLGDFISFYLAMENEVDPTKVPVIEYLKNEFAMRQAPGSPAAPGRTEDDDEGEQRTAPSTTS